MTLPIAMPGWAQIGATAAIWGVAVVVPGPNFLAASRVAATRDRRSALAAVAGIGVGTALWGLAGAFGLRAIFAVAPLLYEAFRLIGGAYLLFVGGGILAASFGPAGAQSPRLAAASAFRLGLLTSVSNPKSALFVASLFAAVMPHGAPLTSSLCVVAEMVAMSLGWYGVVVTVLTTRPAAAVFARLRRWIDRLAGTVFVGFGARLLWERAR